MRTLRNQDRARGPGLCTSEKITEESENGLWNDEGKCT